MISKQQLLALVNPVQVSGSRVVFPTQLALMATDHHNSNLPDAGVIFNPIVLEGLTSDNLDVYVGFGTALSVATELKSIYEKGRLPSVTDLTALSLAQVYAEVVSEMAISKLTQSLINTPSNYWSSTKATGVTFTVEQTAALTSAGIVALVCTGPDSNPSAWRATETVAIDFQTQLSPGYPTMSPAHQALNPWQASGTIKVAQTALATALSPIFHILTPSGEIMSLPATLICDIHFGTPDFANMADVPLEHPYVAHLRMSYSLNSHWRDVPVIGVSHNEEVNKAVQLGTPFRATIGGRPQWAVDRTVVCEQITALVPSGQMKEAARYVRASISAPKTAAATVGFPASTTKPEIA